MSITKEVLEIEESLRQRIKNLLLFLGIKTDIQNGNIINIDNTIYLFFNECNEVYVNTLEQSISITELENHIKTHKNAIK